MKRLLVFIFLTFLFGISKARAATAVNEEISTATVAGISCSSGSVTRVDWVNRTGASTTTIIYPRVKVCIQNQGMTNGFDAFLGFDTNVSTIPGAAAAGWRVYGSTSAGSGNDRCFPAVSGVSIYCKAADAVGVNGLNLAVEQYGKP